MTDFYGEYFNLHTISPPPDTQKDLWKAWEMAEYVQQTVEEMTNEVMQLERVGLFDKVEIKWVTLLLLLEFGVAVCVCTVVEELFVSSGQWTDVSILGRVNHY